MTIIQLTKTKIDSTLLYSYKNGDYNVSIYADGTKVREGIGVPSFPESIDLKITNYCAVGCKYCHEDSTVDGKHGDLNIPFLNTLMPGTELAIGGGNPLTHPDLIPFLKRMKEQGVICNITVNQASIDDSLIDYLISEKLIFGLGLSITGKITSKVKSLVQKYPHLILHVIAGINKIDDLSDAFSIDAKVLILGYKDFRRGNQFKDHAVDVNLKEWYRKLGWFMPKFKVVSFDNLALEQLNVRRLLSPKQWEEFYLGDDGTHTMYIDIPNRKFAMSSTPSTTYDILPDIRDMFSRVRIEKFST
jgi:hypothetical protein